MQSDEKGEVDPPVPTSNQPTIPTNMRTQPTETNIAPRSATRLPTMGKGCGATAEENPLNPLVEVVDEENLCAAAVSLGGVSSRVITYNTTKQSPGHGAFCGD